MAGLLNEKRCCWWCYHHNWQTDRCRRDGRIVTGADGEVCERHETKEEFEKRIFGADMIGGDHEHDK